MPKFRDKNTVDYCDTDAGAIADAMVEAFNKKTPEKKEKTISKLCKFFNSVYKIIIGEGATIELQDEENNKEEKEK